MTPAQIAVLFVGSMLLNSVVSAAIAAHMVIRLMAGMSDRFSCPLVHSKPEVKK